MSSTTSTPVPTTRSRFRRPRTRTVVLVVASALALVFLLAIVGGMLSSARTGGSSGDSASFSSRSSSADARIAPAVPAAPSTQTEGGSDRQQAQQTAVRQQAVVSTGSVDLESKDVAAVRGRIDSILTRLGGQVADETTSTDDQGRLSSTRLVLRIPSAQFDTAMRELAGTGRLISADRKAEDVTTQVVDVKARIAAQEAGLDRLRSLVSSSAGLDDLLRVEQEITQRQAELDSSKQQQAYLADQTNLSTLSVDVHRSTARHHDPVPTAGGFLGGLRHGWHAMTTMLAGVALGLGAVLPFAALLLLLGLPTWLIVRRWRRRRDVVAG